MTVVDDIRARLDIVDVVSGYVALQKSGRSFKAPCPFHTERTPSFIVNPERQSWHCFGACSTGGDAFSFVMRHQNIEFGEALRILAQKAGVELSQASKQNSDKRSKLHAVNRLAASWYQERLKSPEGAAAIDYLKRRGVSPEMIDAFQLGYSPDSWDALKTYLKNMGAPEADAVESGLIYRNDESGRTWDFFRDRLMFPIHDRQGNVIGFGGRQLTEPAPDAPRYNPKYINTAATPIFDKRSSLYGIHRAHPAIRESNTGIIVEGYMDVIAAHQHGYTNVVASMGTALTENQVSQFKSIANNFILALDPDTAGQEATLRSLEASWKVFQRLASYQTPSGNSLPSHMSDPVALKVAALPEGKDPDELIRHDPAEWECLTKNAPPLMSYLIPAIASRFDTSTGQGKTQVVEAIFPLIAATQNSFDQQRYLQDLAAALEVTPDAIQVAVRELSAASRRHQRRQHRGSDTQSAAQQQVVSSALKSNREFTRENYMLGLLLNRPTLQTLLDDFSPEYFRNTANREVFARWMQCGEIDELEASLDEPLREHLQSLLADDSPELDSVESERALNECKQFITKQYLTEVRESRLETPDASTPPSWDLLEEITSLDRGIRATELR